MKLKFWLCNLALLSILTLSAQSKMANVTEIEIDGPIVVRLVKGTETGVEVIKESDLVRWEVNGESLVIMAQYQKGRNSAEIEVTISDLHALETTGSVILDGEGEFATRRMELGISGQSIVNLDVDTEILIARAKSQSILGLSGNADDFQLSVDMQSIVNAESLNCATINVTANRQSVANINTDGAKLTMKTSNQSLVVEK